MITEAAHPSGGRSSRIVAASLLIHLVLLLGLLYRSHAWVAAVRMPGTRQGTRLVLTYLPGRAPSAVSAAVSKPARQKLSPSLLHPALKRALALPAPAQPVSLPQQEPSSGVSALGEGDISIALMQFFPDPRPDLSRLPHGSRGDVVLEAVINAEGHIEQLRVKQGLGYGVDESVMATVQQWTFHPAMRDGMAVPSQQEFHFHYERG